MEIRKKVGFILGPLLFFLIYFAPILSENPRAHDLLAVFLLVVVWWVTECIPIPVTALLIPVFITILKISTVKEALTPFANPIILLFLGSFILARAMYVHGIDLKLAYSVLSLKSIRNKPIRILFALGLTSMFLSMWISNTATTAMMYPIALGVLSTFHQDKKKTRELSFGVVLLLTLAYAASIGGIGTPIIIAITQAVGINPLPPVLGSAIGCSFAFMLPVATPPNAIIYGSGLIKLPQMMKAGFWLNIAGILIIWLSITFLAPLLGLI